ncbi:murein biosynthesis integral membrane protein MurJ [Actinopolymorpha pittospori]|uniref:Peptidoglycan lipid II flippase n=1 Tax=Actinopolymorpha pittospori TaxID=648752 RepID=A0A927MX95_9ACTN|nr:murein biosynthesis integral membrane protein MurJ [Actinopolymorpha pittospori]MBE1604992.1 putative peptidoglycan lipid II flippase [Actinopolymorpha pittospori]
MSGDIAATEKTPQQEESSLLRAGAVMALGTMVSRVTGFGKSVVLVWAIGTTFFADTFNLANTVPNSLYFLIAGGALNAVFVPQLVRAMKNDPDGGQAFGQRLLTLATTILLGMSVVAVLCAPLLIRAYSGSDMTSPANRPYFDLAVAFAWYTLPQIFFFGLYVILGQILNARGRFGPMMWAPILNNLVAIAVYVSFIVVSDADTPQEITGGEIALLGLGATLGIAVQALCLLPVLRRAGFKLRPRFDFRGGGIGKSSKLALWTIGFVLVNQVWFVVATRLTTGVSTEALAKFGDESAYGLTPYLNAYQILMLPHAVITVSIVAALLPRMSRSAADGDHRRVRADLSYGLRVTAAAIIPASVAFLALGPDLTGTLYFFLDSGGGDAHARFVGYVLMGFALGLVGFSSHHIVLRGFYAYEDTRTPVFVQMGLVLAGIACAVTAYFVLPVQWKTVGIAAAYGISYWVGFFISLTVLRRRLGGVDGRHLLSTYLRAGAAALIPGVVAYGLSRLLTTAFGDGLLVEVIALLSGGVILLGGYLLLARVFRIREISELLGLVRGRLGRSAA